MITIKNQQEIEYMRQANRLVGEFLNLVEERIKPGMATYDIEKIAVEFLIKNNVKGAFYGVNDFPANTCVSIDDEVVHGVPSKKRYLEEGQIVSIDFGVIFNGYNGDAARTFAVGQISREKEQLIRVTRESFFEGIKILKNGVRLGDLGHAIQSYAESFGYGVVRELTGHGIGRKLHEDPMVLNYGEPGRGLRVATNMTLAIEPMINLGTYKVEALENDTIVTADGKPSAHYENTVLIKDDGVEILSLV